MNVTTLIFHDTRRVKLNGKYPVKLRVTFNREQHYFPFPSSYDLTIEDFLKVFGIKPRKDLKQIQELFLNERNRADNIIKDLGNKFSFVLFEKKFLVTTGKERNVFKILEQKANELRKNDCIGTAVNYECTLQSFKKYYRKEKLDIESIDVAFLSNYEKWMLQNGKSKATIGMYLRNIRTIYGTAIRSGVIPSELYPFGKQKEGKYTIPVGKNTKKVLSFNEVALIYNAEGLTISEEKAKDFWLFLYLANGINNKDIARLKFSNIDGDMIRFERAKTERANKDNPIIISFALSDDLKRIISKWGNKSLYGGNYIFPILTKNMTAEQEYKTIQLFTRFINDNMKKIAVEVGIKANVTTYVARHSFATVLKRSGKSIEFISEALGHSNIATTRNYLADFNDEAKKVIAGELVNFTQVAV